MLLFVNFFSGNETLNTVGFYLFRLLLFSDQCSEICVQDLHRLGDGTKHNIL
jgi:hypothetical protein